MTGRYVIYHKTTPDLFALAEIEIFTAQSCEFAYCSRVDKLEFNFKNISDTVPPLSFGNKDRFEWVTASDYAACENLCGGSPKCRQFGFFANGINLCVLAPFYFDGLPGNQDMLDGNQKYL